MSWDYDFAREFKKRDNQEIEGAVIGTVISVDPLSVSLFSGSVILNNRNSYVCSNLGIFKELFWWEMQKQALAQ